MKPYVLILFAAGLLSSLNASAQQRIFFGVTAGGSSMHLSGDVPENASYTSKTGFSAGLIGEYALSNDIRISLQPSYCRRGSGVAYDVGELDPRDSLDLTLDYLSFPVIARFISPGGSWFVNGGLDLGLLLKGSMKDITTGTSRDIHTLVNGVDMMMIIGVGYVIHFEPPVLSFELRYGQSLLNAGANDNLAANLGFSPRFRSAGFQLLAALIFPL